MKRNLSRPTTRALLLTLWLSLFCLGLVQAQVSTAQYSGWESAGLGSKALSLPQNSGAPVDKELMVYGAKIHYVEAGSGPVVILLHGLGGNTQNWALNIGALAAKFRVIVPDQIGFGRSDKPVINYRIGTYVDFLEQLCKQLKIERASIAGVSMGGWIAAAFTVAHPERVERLVLIDAAGYALPADFDERKLINLNPSTREGMKQLAATVFYNKQVFTSDAMIDQMMTQRINAGDGYTIRSITESIMRREDSLDNRLSVIKQPTLVIWGREDGLLPLSDGERFKKDIAGSTLLVFDLCGHVPNVEKAAEFNVAILKFLTASPN